jgi:hypothetical protein
MTTAGAEDRDYCRSRRLWLLKEQKTMTTAGAEDYDYCRSRRLWLLKEQKTMTTEGTEDYDYCSSRRVRLLQVQKSQTTAGAEDCDYFRNKIISFRSQGSSVGVVTGLRAGSSRNLGFISGRDRNSISSPKRPYRPWFFLTQPLTQRVPTIFPQG